MCIIAVDPQADRRWDAFVAAHPEGLIYHHSRWSQVIEEAYGYPVVGLACEGADGRLLGLLPLCSTQGWLTGRCLASLPRTPVAGPLVLDAEAAALLRAAVERVRAEPGTPLQIKAPSGELDGLVHGMVGVPWDLTYVRELPAHPGDLRFGNSRNHGRVKWAVHKAAKSGLEVRPAQTEGELRAWYRLYLDTMRDHAVPPRPYRFFKVCWERLAPCGLMCLLLAEQCADGQPRLLAGSVFLRYGQTVVYAFNGRWRERLALRPNDAIHWRAMHDACVEGFRRYDFGEVTAHQKGLAEFKAKWGGRAKTSAAIITRRRIGREARATP